MSQPLKTANVLTGASSAVLSGQTTQRETRVRDAGGVFLGFAGLLCFVLTALMVLNTQMSGEAMWFWYATVFRNGAKLYSDLHTPLQPLFVLETAAWMGMFGKKIAIYELPSLMHAMLLALGIYLILRESVWPKWQKAIVLFSSFVFVVAGHSYRFDDYHVLAEVEITYALLLLLVIARQQSRGEDRWALALVAALGVVCGLTFVTRVTDGAALCAASFLCLPIVLTRRKAARLAVLVGTAAATVVLVVMRTGDTLPTYLSNSIFRAAGSKGGTGSIFAAPFLMIAHTLGLLDAFKKIEIGTAVLALSGVFIARYRPNWVRYLVPLQLALAALIYWALGPKWQAALNGGLFFEFMALLLTTSMYVAFVLVVTHYVRHKRVQAAWDSREILIVLPILEWASYAAGAAAEPLTNYYAPAALLVLLIVVVQPFRKFAAWANPTAITLLLLLALCGVASKVSTPYSWQNYRYGPMFQNRAWYRHPLYGEMYIDRDLLHFSERVCGDIRAYSGDRKGGLLSLPYPYPNYFCGIPPWHNYVQTFFDTATRATVNNMMQELESAPPQWIVYQRQINIMVGSEKLYNHGRPLAQRALDKFIMDKLTSGQWKLVDRSSYLRPSWWSNRDDTDWYIIRTRP